MPEVNISTTADGIIYTLNPHGNVPVFGCLLSLLLVCMTQGECSTVRISYTHREHLFSSKGSPSEINIYLYTVVLDLWKEGN